VGAEERGVIPLADTLVALVESLEPPEGSGLAISAATLDVPLEGWVADGRERPIFLASVPHTRWISGFLPSVHVAHIEIGESDDR
jgi:hypothetical protein